MSNRLTQWSPYLGALGFAMIVAAILMGLVTSTRRDVLLLFAGLGVILIALFLITRPRGQVHAAVTGRSAVYGSNSLILVAAFIGIIIAINVISNRQVNQRVDLTANQQNTLSQQTVQVLQNLQDPVKVTAFFTPDTGSLLKQTQDELKLYQRVNDKLQVQFVDPDVNPALARQYDIVQPGTIVFELGKRTEKVYSADESTFTNAILKVTQTQQPVLYFTSGHGEYSPVDSDQNGMQQIANLFQQVNYKVDILNMATISNTTSVSTTMPADASAVIIAGPTKPFAAEDEQRIKTYLEHGGRVLLLADPLTDPGLKDMLTAWGLTFNDDLVLDPAQNYRGNPAIPVFTNFPNFPVTKDLEQFGVYFPGARSLKETTGTDKVATALFSTTSEACAKTDLNALQGQQQLPQCDPAKDGKGPFEVGYAIQDSGQGKDQARLLVMGNGSFATNRWQTTQDSVGNQQMMLNAVNWLAGQEQLIAIPPRDPSARPLSALTGTESNFLALSSILLVPLFIGLIGAVIWWRRR